MDPLAIAGGLAAVLAIAKSSRALYESIISWKQHSTQLEKELQVLEMLVSTYRTYFLSECRHVFPGVDEEKRLENCEEKIATASERERAKLEDALRITLGEFYTAYSRTLQNMCTVICQCDAFLKEMNTADRNCSEQVILKIQSRIERLTESNRALSILRKLSVGTSNPSHSEPLDLKMVPSQMKVVLAASRILYEASILVLESGFALERDYQQATLSFEETCGRTILTLLFSQNSPSLAASLKISFHVDQHMFEHWSADCEAKDPHVIFEKQQSKDIWQDSSAASYNAGFRVTNQDERQQMILNIWSRGRPIICRRRKADNTARIMRDKFESLLDADLRALQATSIGHKWKRTMKRRCKNQLPPLSQRKRVTGLYDGYAREYLAREGRSKHSSSDRKSIGHIVVTRTHEVAPNKAANLLELIRSSTFISPEMTKLDRLHLAHDVAYTLVQFYSTPFIQDDWSLSDFGVVHPLNQKSTGLGFGFNPTVLFLRNGLDFKRSAFQPHGGPHGGPHFGHSNALALECDSYCRSSLRPFYNLGIALLEIAYLRSYSFLRSGTLNSRTTQEVLTWQNPLGKRYREIIVRCLDGDLGVPSSSSVLEIRNAAYTCIVCVLRDMIRYISS